MTTPAFPTHWQDEAAGMSLRTYIAAKVLPEIVAATSKGMHHAGAVHLPDPNATIEQKMVADAFALADAFVEAVQ
jgi:hypothetical protein